MRRLGAVIDLSSAEHSPFLSVFRSLRNCWRCHTGLAKLLSDHRPDAVAVEDLFYAKNARSALKLGHVRGVLLLAASQADIPIAEYTPTQVKRAVVGYGRAAKHQVQEMVSLLLALDERPSPLDISDALAVAICHAHLQGGRPRRDRKESTVVAGAAKLASVSSDPSQRIMIGSLHGRLSEKQPSRLVVDVQGVGYELQVPLSNLLRVGRSWV